MKVKDRALDAFKGWCASLKRYSDFPAKGTISGALVVLDRLKQDYKPDIDEHTAEGGSQIKGASGEAARRILAQFGETRRFVSEGGRTNRGLRGDIKAMLNMIRSMRLDTLPKNERNDILTEMQLFLVANVREFHNRQRLDIVYDPSKSAWQSIYDLLAQARESGKEGPVAQYLVGAKLQLRFPDEEITNRSYSTADEQSNRPGDFLVGNTAFHVTVAPLPAIYDKCRRNIDDGFRVYLLVPERSLVGAKQNAEATLPGRITVESIESFVGQNLEELSIFSNDKLGPEFCRLLEIYNERVNAVEFDKSMLIEIPPNLRRTQ